MMRQKACINLKKILQIGNHHHQSKNIIGVARAFHKLFYKVILLSCGKVVVSLMDIA
jgi:hypothetical protein